jgi:predicted DNA-binding transcriptional regulator AlpA
MPLPIDQRDPYPDDAGSAAKAPAQFAAGQRANVHNARTPPDLMDVRAVCEFFGGSKPLDQSTLYRGIAVSRYPRPIYVGAKAVRWLRSECEATMTAMIAARDSTAA